MAASHFSNGPTEWDLRHRAAAQGGAVEPASFVVELLPLLPRGPALDLACGTGRHALLLAARRQAVSAVDSSSVGLDILEERARGLGLKTTRLRNPESIAPGRDGIDLMQINLERAVLPESSFAVILCVQYLHASAAGVFWRAEESGTSAGDRGIAD
jgi:SAM-dependent methyltransferase